MKLKKWQKLGLIWALWMFIIMTFVFPFFSGENITLKKTLIGIPIWFIGGLVFGYSQRKNFEKKE